MIDYSKIRVTAPWDRRAALEELRAEALHRREHSRLNSTLSGTWNEPIYQNAGNFTALASSAAEGTLLAGISEQPWLPAGFFAPPSPPRRAVLVEASGVFSNTGTPTLIFQARLSSTQGSSTLSGTSVGVSAAITTTSGVTNVWWKLRLRLQLFTPGQGTTNATLQCNGEVASPAGFASPFAYPLEPTTPNTATWTATIDGALNQYLNLSATWSASSSSNTIQVKSLVAHGIG